MVVGYSKETGTRDTSSVAVGLSSSTTKTVKSVSITPSLKTLSPGQTQQFTAEVTYSDGTKGTGAAWSATGGSISSSGLYTAGSTTGTFRVIGQASGSTVKDTSTVTISTAAITPTPSVSNLASSNRPTDHTTIQDIIFDSKYPTSWSFSHKWSDPTYMQLISDAAAPRSAQKGIEFGFPAGFEDVNSPARANTVFSASREMYVAVWMKISKPWQYHTSSVNKLFTLSTNGHSTWGNEVIVALKGTSESNAQIQIGVQSPLNTGAGTKNGFYLPNISMPGFSLGVWHLIEVKGIRSTGGLANGRLIWWVDGKMVGSHSNVKFYSYGDSYFNGMILDPNWGGQGSPPKAWRDWIRVDHLLITRKI
jgi:hypothetical protein